MNLSGALDGATYLITKSSGFVCSYSALKERIANRIFTSSRWGRSSRICLQVLYFDVRPDDYEHAVLNYARPIFLRLEQRTDGGC